jgi:hypothetical protein
MTANIHLQFFLNHNGSYRHWFLIDRHGLSICAFGTGFSLFVTTQEN